MKGFWTTKCCHFLLSAGRRWYCRNVQYYPLNVICHNEHHLHSTLCRAHFLWKRRTGMLAFIWLAFQIWFVRASPGFVHSDDLSKRVIAFPSLPVQQSLCDCIAVPMLHLENFMGYPTRSKFSVTQNVEHSFVTYSRLALLTHTALTHRALCGMAMLHHHMLHSPWKHSCVLWPRATSILIQEHCSSFVNMVLGRTHYPYESQCSTHCSILTEYCRHWLQLI